MTSFRSRRPTALAAAALMLAWTTTAAGARAGDGADLIQDSIKTLEELTAAPDNGIPQHLLDRAEAILVIPSLIKGGFIVGAKHGRGVLSVRDRIGGSWSDPAFVTLTGGSIGWQIGAQSVDLVLLVMNKNGVEELLKDKFTLSGAASVAAGPVGRSSEAGTNARMDAKILAYSRAKGLFAGATLEGASLSADESAIKDFYGQSYSVRDITTTGVKTPMPPAVALWKSMLAKIAGTTGAAVDMAIDVR